LGPLEVQQFVLAQHNNEGMLPLRLSYVIGINVFGEIWIAHMNLGFSGTSSRG
jgi:hypothetical protein